MPSPFAPILAQLGFHELAAVSDSLSTTASWRGPRHHFRTHRLVPPHLPFLLKEHPVAGLYPLRHLLTLACGTKIETLASNRCITITFEIAGNSPKLFAGGMEITWLDLYNDGTVVVHVMKGFVSHLTDLVQHRASDVALVPTDGGDLHHSPDARRCHASPPHQRIQRPRPRPRAPSQVLGPLGSALHDVFVLDDDTIFASGHSFVADLHLHVVPNRRLMAVDLENLLAATVVAENGVGAELGGTTAGGEALLRQ